MRRTTIFLLPWILVACSDADPAEVVTSGAGGSDGTGAAGTGAGGSGTGAGTQGGDPLDFPDHDDFDEDATVDDALDLTITEPTQLTGDGGTLAAITADDRLVFTGNGATFSIKAASTAPTRKVASASGTVHVKGNTVFTFADVDYSTGLGDLVVWTPAVGRRSFGWVMFGEERIAARHDDAHVLFMKDVQTDTVDIIVASADKLVAQILVDDAGRASESTCGPSFGFAGDAAVVSWCEVGSTTATLARFVLTGDSWERHDISDAAAGSWASDASGETFFYVASGGIGMLTDLAAEQKLGSGVGSGLLRPDGGAVYFNVGDQLRKGEMGGPTIPIVVDGFSRAAAWTPDFESVLYSSQIVYEGSQKQDLRVTPTDWFNPEPKVLVAQPVATLARDALTHDGNYALYFTDVGEEGGKLHVHPTSGAAAKTMPGVDVALAAGGSWVVFTDNRTGPGVFPALADLKIVDAASAVAPTLIEADVVDGRDVQVRSDRLAIAFRRDGDATTGGIWLRPLPAAP